MSGRGASAQFRFGNRKPGSSMPLLFELTDKHLKDCERMYVFLYLSCNLRKNINNFYNFLINMYYFVTHLFIFFIHSNVYVCVCL